jgi:hypothetical protein
MPPAERLEAQLDDQARRFLATPAKNRVDAEDGVVYLSPIFMWYGADYDWSLNQAPRP